MGLFRNLLLALIACALIGASSGQRARAAQCGPVAMSSDLVMKSTGTAQCAGMLPGKTVKSDCVKHPCCVTTIAQLPDVAGAVAAVRLGAVTYWQVAFDAAGLSRRPEFVPLRTS